VVPGEDRICQIVKVLATSLALVPLAMGLGIVSPLLGDVLGSTLGTGHTIRPVHLADSLEAFGVIYEVLDIYDHDASIQSEWG
jgi:hypothetical protein